jgi:hypothetical protein
VDIDEAFTVAARTFSKVAKLLDACTRGDRDKMVNMVADIRIKMSRVAYLLQLGVRLREYKPQGTSLEYLSGKVAFLMASLIVELSHHLGYPGHLGLIQIQLDLLYDMLAQLSAELD